MPCAENIQSLASPLTVYNEACTATREYQCFLVRPKPMETRVENVRVGTRTHARTSDQAWPYRKWLVLVIALASSVSTWVPWGEGSGSLWVAKGTFKKRPKE